MEQNNYNNKIEFNNPNDFVDSILYNWIIISLKSVANTTQLGLLMQDLFKGNEDYSEIVSIYDHIIEDKSRDDYFSHDLKLVHRINEFQAVYFMLNIYSKLKQFNFEFLSPDCFLNGLFICRFLQENKEEGSNSNKIYILLTENKSIQSLFSKIRNDFNIKLNFIRPQMSSSTDELNHLIQSIKIN